MTEALERHDQNTATANMPRPASAAPATPTIGERPAGEAVTEPAQPPDGSQTANVSARQRVRVEAAPAASDGEGASRRERDIAAFRERRRQAAEEAREEARKRIARTGELACVADALTALAHPAARPWDTERQELERALRGGRIVEVGAAARRSLWAINRDAARSSRRARRDPDLAARGVCRVRDHRAPDAHRGAHRAAGPSGRCPLAVPGSARSGAEQPATRATSGPAAAIRREQVRRLIV